MLTPRQIEQVKATVPVLREHGVLLTTHFYRRMLEGNPELRNIFNQAHQARGRQQKEKRPPMNSSKHGVPHTGSSPT